MDRKEVDINILQVNYPSDHVAPDGRCLLVVELKDRVGMAWGSIPVQLVNPSQALQLNTMTDGQGYACFEVDPGLYELDVDGEKGFARVAIPNDTSRIEISYQFARKDFSEHVNPEGYTIQKLNDHQKCVTGRVLVELMVRKENGSPANQRVEIRQANSTTQYLGYTDQEGQVNFMLPRGHDYSVNFEFQENAETIDLTSEESTGQMILWVDYLPEERLAHPERFLPTKDELKTYDLNNVLTGQYEDTPDDNLINFHARWGNKKIGSGSQEAIMEMGFSVKSGYKPTQTGKPVNLVFVLDKSGSMSFERIDILKHAMRKMVEELRPEDKVSVVVFDTKATVAYPFAPANKDRIKDVVYAVQADGGTSIYEGLKMGYKDLKKAFDPNATNRVILLTDGYGSKPVDDVLALSQSYFQKGISVSTIGIGAGYNHNLLTLLSQYSGGMAHQAIDNLALTDAFKKEFQSLMYPLASNVKVTVSYNNQIVFEQLHGIPLQKEGNGKVEFSLANIFTSMNQTALLKFKLDNPTPAIANEPVVVTMTYFDEQKGMPVEISQSLPLEWTDETDLEIVTTEQQKRIYTLAVINQCNKIIADLCENGEYEGARQQIKETLRAIKKTNDNKFSADFKPYIEQLEHYLIAIESAIKAGQHPKDVVME
jgi:Ca-activated chloride channel family protein